MGSGEIEKKSTNLTLYKNEGNSHFSLPAIGDTQYRFILSQKSKIHFSTCSRNRVIADAIFMQTYDHELLILLLLVSILPIVVAHEFFEVPP